MAKLSRLMMRIEQRLSRMEDMLFILLGDDAEMFREEGASPPSRAELKASKPEEEDEPVEEDSEPEEEEAEE